MSVLPATLTLQPFPRRKQSAPERKQRGILTDSASHHGRRTSPAGRGSLAGDFASLYQTYRQRVFFQCFHMLRNQCDAEDAAQEVYLQLFRKVHTFRGQSSFSTWLHRLTTNCVLMQLRRRHHWRVAVIPQEASSGAEAESPVVASLDALPAPPTHVLDRVSIDIAFAQLPFGYQRVLELHDIEGYTHGEIATLLGIEAGTSKSQLHRARLRMRLLLQTGGKSINTKTLPQS